MDKKDLTGISKLILSLIYALLISLNSNYYFFAAASIIPFILLFKIQSTGLKILLRINFINLIMLLTMVLTWPSFYGGLKAGLIITLRLNLICIVFIKLIEDISEEGLYSVISLMPEKIQILMILTIRGINIMRESVDTSLTAVKLRGSNLKGIKKLKIIGYVIASSILKSSFKSERIYIAIKCRGGFKGFNQC